MVIFVLNDIFILIHYYQCSAEPSAFMKNSEHFISKMRNMESEEYYTELSLKL